MRDQQGAPTIQLRREDVEVLADFIGETGPTVIDRLGALMGATATQRRAMAGMFLAGAVVICLAGGTVTAISADRGTTGTGPAPTAPITVVADTTTADTITADSRRLTAAPRPTVAPTSTPTSEPEPDERDGRIDAAGRARHPDDDGGRGCRRLGPDQHHRVAPRRGRDCDDPSGTARRTTARQLSHRRPVADARSRRRRSAVGRGHAGDRCRAT